MTLTAADISSHQVVSSWPVFLGSVDVLICKISEGTGYAWAGSAAALAQARAAGKLIGAYHYAGVAGKPLGDPVREADYFLAHYAWRPGEVPILDYEPAVYPADPDGWCAAWLSRVKAKLGVVPMIYLNHYYAVNHSTWTRTRALGPGLWSAWYGANTGVPLPGEPSFAPWSEAMWQYTSNGSKPGISYPLDLSLFYGSPAAWRAFGTPQTAPQPAPTTTKDSSVRVVKTPDGTIWLATDLEVAPITDPALAQAADAAWGPTLALPAAQVQALAADADARRARSLTDVSRNVLCRTPDDRTGAWLWDRIVGVDDKTGAIGDDVKALGQTTAPVIDETKLAAALLADPASVAALGKAIADNLQLAPRSTASGAAPNSAAQ